MECTFGTLKIRCRILLYPSELHHLAHIEDVFKCCCIFHNMILAYDRDHHMECQLWENVDWSVLDPDDLSEEVVDALLHEAQRNLDVETALPSLSCHQLVRQLCHVI